MLIGEANANFSSVSLNHRTIVILQVICATHVNNNDNNNIFILHSVIILCNILIKIFKLIYFIYGIFLNMLLFLYIPYIFIYINK